MTNVTQLFHYKKPNPTKLRPFGFTEAQGTYTYSTPIADKQFLLTITITAAGNVSTCVLDISSEEEYVLHLTQGAVGSFIATVREDYENVLHTIAETCFDSNAFKSTEAQDLIQYVRDTFHDELEFLWPRSPTNAILRRQDTQKWYAALLVISRRKLGMDSDELVNILDLRMNPQDITQLVDGKHYHPGFHMNKKHWVTLCLDGSLPLPEIISRLHDSYALAIK